MRQNGGWKRLNFAETDRFPAQWFPRDTGGLDAGTQRQIAHPLFSYGVCRAQVVKTRIRA